MSARSRVSPLLATLAVLVPALLVPASAALAQGSQPQLSCADRDSWSSDDRARFCEIRERTFPAGARLDVDAEPNGGIRVHGADRSDVRMIARIETSAGSDADAKALASQVRVEVGDGRVHAEGPSQHRRSNWSVSYELWVPRRSNLALQSLNGGVAIDDVDGTIQARSTNGGISLYHVSGDVHGETSNGGVHAALDGDRWRGAGLDLETTNGGVTLDIPRGYSARLETGTTNGGFHIDFPITVQGTLGRHLTTQLGSGGAPIRAVTTNGGVTIRER